MIQKLLLEMSCGAFPVTWSCFCSSIVMQDLKCFLSVGLLVKFPDAGFSKRVQPSVEHNIYANDVFKKIKDLIG